MRLGPFTQTREMMHLSDERMLPCDSVTEMNRGSESLGVALALGLSVSVRRQACGWSDKLG